MLTPFRQSLLRLHKTLIDSERAHLETSNGASYAPHEWWDMLTNDPCFEWLRPFTRLIVDIDEATAKGRTPGPEHAASLVSRARDLLDPPAPGLPEAFQAAADRDAAVAAAHKDALAQLHSIPAVPTNPPDDTKP